jgi:Protein-L-isoaspartate(D-aspartate) O-methyltransferase (PCMT)
MPRSTIRTVPEMDFVSRRSDMVEHQIAARGVRSKLVLEAVRKVPREEFLPPSLREFAYEDSPLPIAEGQTGPDNLDFHGPAPLRSARPVVHDAIITFSVGHQPRILHRVQEKLTIVNGVGLAFLD